MTTESQFDPWLQHRQHAESWTPSPGLVVFVVPHPDDEVLMMGGLLQNVLSNHHLYSVIVLAVTDGEAAYPLTNGDDLASTRRHEQDVALRHLALAQVPPVVRLGLPDSGVHLHTQTLVDAIAEIAESDSVIVAPWRRDYHSDHEACGQAAHTAAQNLGCSIAEGLFWAWSHLSPNDKCQLSKLDLTSDQVYRRRAALEAHSSQLRPPPPFQPVLTGADLEPLHWNEEFYFVSGGTT